MIAQQTERKKSPKKTTQSCFVQDHRIESQKIRLVEINPEDRILHKKKTLCESTTKQQENSTTNLLKPPWVVVFSDAVTQPLFSDCYALWTTTGTYFFWPSGSGGGGKVRATLGPLSGTAAEVLHWARQSDQPSSQHPPATRIVTDAAAMGGATVPVLSTTRLGTQI